MSLKDTKEMEEARAKLEEARADVEKLSATISDQESAIMSMKTVLQRLNEENESLDIENAKLDAENATLVKSLEMKCLELLKSKSAPRVVVSAPLTTNSSSASTAAVTSSGRPVKGVVKMSFAEANPDIMRELRWIRFWEIVERRSLPMVIVAVVLYGFWRYWL